MFDVNKPEMVNKTFRMPLSLIKTLQEVAQNKNVSLNFLIIQCCEYALKNLKKNKEEHDG
jgi:predicted HicB family RNase H-like nuclease